MNSRIRISNNDGVTRIVIPALQNRLLSLLWFPAAAVSAFVFLTLLRKAAWPMLPLLLLWAVLLVVFTLKGISGYLWSLRGMEVFESSPQRLIYRRDGTILEQKDMRVENGDLDIRVLWIGIGDNRLEISSSGRRMFCGSSISKDEANQVRELLLRSYRG